MLHGISGEVQTLTYWDPTTMLHGISGDVSLRRVVHKIHDRKFTPPAGEVCRRRPPTAILIGKCSNVDSFSGRFVFVVL